MNEAEVQRIKTENEYLRNMINAQMIVLEDQNFALQATVKRYTDLLQNAINIRNVLDYAREVLSENGIALDPNRVDEIIRNGETSSNDDADFYDEQIDGVLDDSDEDEDDDHVEDITNWPRYDRKWIWSE